jgi:hypothetical protein
MALAFRIDSITPAGGKVVVGYTYGVAPLPGPASGLGMETSVADLNAQLAEIDPKQVLLMLAFSMWKAANPALNNPSLVLGKTITITPGNSTTPVTVA